MRISRIGYWCALAAFSSTIFFGVAQALQLAGVLHYPLDEILIYSFSICIVIPFLLTMIALHSVTPEYNKFWSHTALVFTVIYAIFVTANYVVQLATVIPLTINGDSEKIEILRQTPHSLFWDFDAIGYICMGLATLFAVPLFERTGFQRWVRYSLLAHALVTPLIAFVYFYPIFTEQLLLIGIPWSITAPLFLFLLALWFKKSDLSQKEN
ncbi:MAG: hypothetical protein ACOVMQ_08685 [Cyclobacteriaceae bacterium]|jgi:hypothetical protein